MMYPNRGKPESVLITELLFVSTNAAPWLEEQGYKHGNKSKQVSLRSLEGSYNTLKVFDQQCMKRVINTRVMGRVLQIFSNARINDQPTQEFSNMRINNQPTQEFSNVRINDQPAKEFSNTRINDQPAQED
jgi:hypothetical protein